MQYVYVVWVPGDRLDQLDWFYVFPTRKQAMNEARNRALELGEWKVKYLPYKTDESDSYIGYEGTRTIVVEQATHYYHGA